MNESKSKTEYKDTLNLPDTPFPMKANLPQREPEILKKWETINLYQILLEQNKEKPAFILNDGPPFANGDIHLGHAVNKALKDMVLKSKWLSGMRAPFVPGWDCHGLPIELNVEKKFGKPGVKLDAKAFREQCRLYVDSQIDAQRHSFIRLGVLGDWKHPYKTMDYQYEADIIRSLAKIVKNGHVHKGLKPVHWCIDCGSALAEAEVEYKNKTSPAIDVGFEVVNTDILPAGSSIVIWTTTPWTLPANQAVAVHPEFEYVLIEATFTDNQKRKLVVAKDLLDAISQRIGFTETKILKTLIGRNLEGIKLQHPFLDRQVPVVLGEHVTLDTGTGAVHTAPAHGLDDYLVGQKYHLPLDNPVGGNGCFLSTVPIFANEPVFKTNDKIIQLLKEKNQLLHFATMEHSYPHCWRHKSPLIFRATPQWFIGMDQNGLRKKALVSIEAVEWIPNWGEGRLKGMIADRPDWCISRQRTWGVPLSFFVHQETGDLHPETPELMEKVAQYVEKGGVDAWYELNAETLLKNSAKDYQKINDTIDVWFDSGVAHDCVLEKRPELHAPADLYLEGSDQHRGWFQSSFLTAIAMNEKAPFKQVLTHGFVVDSERRKMSKSIGNVVSPEKIVQTLGADILRLWVAATDYRSEMAVSDEILKRIADTYRRIRNTARFLLANLNGFDPEHHIVPVNQMMALDRWIVERAQNLQTEIQAEYHQYQFHNVYQKIHNFCSVDLGSFYLDVIKDRQYTGKRDGIPRRSAQTALYYLVESLVRWMAPILSFTAEEIWQFIPGKRESSVFMSEWFQAFPKKLKEISEEQHMDQHYWEQILAIREKVNKKLEEARAGGLIGSGLEAKVSLYSTQKIYTLLQKLKHLEEQESELRFVLITSQADSYLLETEQEPAEFEKALEFLKIEIHPSTDPKCERCWHRRSDVNQNSAYPGICGRCVENIGGVGEKRYFA